MSDDVQIRSRPTGHIWLYVTSQLEIVTVCIDVWNTWPHTTFFKWLTLQCCTPGDTETPGLPLWLFCVQMSGLLLERIGWITLQHLCSLTLLGVFILNTEKYRCLQQCFWTFVRPRPGKSFFHKTRARCQQIYSSVHFQFFLSSYIKLTKVLIINYGIIIKSISRLMCRVWRVDKNKITFKLIINSRRISRGPV